MTSSGIGEKWMTAVSMAMTRLPEEGGRGKVCEWGCRGVGGRKEEGGVVVMVKGEEEEGERV